MSLGLVFHPETRIIEITASPEDEEIEVDSLFFYSEWKRWVLGNLNSKWISAFATIGGEPIGGEQFISPYVFLTNGWKIKPPEQNCVITVNGNLILDGGGTPFITTDGPYTVKVVSQVSSNSLTTILEGDCPPYPPSVPSNLIEISISGGDYIYDSEGNIIISFYEHNSSINLNSSLPLINLDVLLVGGGGAGAVGIGTSGAGGGGGGGVVESKVSIPPGLNLIQVGRGGFSLAKGLGTRHGENGEDTIAFNLRANGGGGGGAGNGAFNFAKSGGSGGGAGGVFEMLNLGGSSLDNQGNSGGSSTQRVGGGGGGAGQPGQNGSITSPGNGGDGIISFITGQPIYYGGGGGGSSTINEEHGKGGLGGGGDGSSFNINGLPGANGFGGGGGGTTGVFETTSGPGGNGIVIVKIPNNPNIVIQSSV